MRKLTLTLILTLLLLAITITQNNLTTAYYTQTTIWQGEVSAPEGVKPPEILVLFPINNSFLPTRDISFLLNVSVQPPLPLSELYIQTSWESEKRVIDVEALYNQHNNKFPFNISINFTEIPQGKHWIMINATSVGFAGWNGTEIGGSNEYGTPIVYLYYLTYNVTSNERVYFAIDTNPPIITINSLENNFFSPNANLFFSTSEQTSKLAYSLDGEEKIPITSNISFSHLNTGIHSLTLYAWDLAGNAGISQTTTFYVLNPLILSVIVIISALAILSIVVLYAKKHKRLKFKQSLP